MLIIKEDGDVLDTEGMRKDCYMKCGKYDMIYLYIGDPADPEVDPEVDDPRATNNMLYKTTDLKHQYSNRRPVDNQQRERPRDPSAATHYPPLDTVQPCP